MKRVLYVAHENTKGGATHSLINILDNIPKNIRPYVLIPNTINVGEKFKKENKSLINAGTLKDELEKRKIQFYEAYYYLDNLNIKQNILKKIFFSTIRNNELNKMKKIVKENKIEIIHSNSSVIKFGADLARICNLKHIWHVREDVTEMFNIEIENLKGYFRNILEKSDYVVFVSESLKKNFQKKIKTFLKEDYEVKIKFITIYNGIPLNNSYHILNKHNSTFKIYSFGTVYDIKGQEDLIYLAIKMRDSGFTNFSINLVGLRKKEYYDFLQSLITKNKLEKFVNFIDYTNNLYSLRNEASVEVVCSRNEAFGRVAIEAMNHGNPLIVTNVGGLNEIVEHSKNGFKYKPGDIEELFKNILLILNREIDVETLVKNAQERSEDFNIKECVFNITKLY